MADFPSRCQHIKVNGTQCGSPALRRNRFCFFHKRFQDERIRLAADRKRRGAPVFVLPVLEDANSIQVALMQVMRLLVTQQIEHKTASLLLYALQTASTNLRMTNFKPFHHEVILDPRDADQSFLGESKLWCDEDFEEEPDEAETAADRAIAELERVKKEKEEKAKWRKWAEMQYPDPNKPAAALAKAKQAVEAKKPPLPNLTKPASEMTNEEIRADIIKMVRDSGLADKYRINAQGQVEKKPPQPTPQPEKTPEQKAT